MSSCSLRLKVPQRNRRDGSWQRLLLNKSVKMKCKNEAERIATALLMLVKVLPCDMSYKT